jgi:CRP-like cAMP-binding protein
MASGIPTKSELKKNLKLLKERLEERPMDLDARMRIARTYRLLDKKSDAAAHYAAVARYLSLAGHPLQAIAVLKELLQVDPQHEETLLFLAKLYARTRAADVTNRGRVAVPILEPAADGSPISTLQDGIPLTTTGIWRAIAPLHPEDLAIVHSPEELGARAEGERDIGDDDVVEASPDDETARALPQRDTEVDPRPPAGASKGGSREQQDVFSVDDLNAEDYEVLGQVTTGDVLLPSVPLFSSLTPAEFVQLSHSMVFLKAAAGSVIFEEGQPGDSCVVISRGRARVSRKGDDGAVIELLHLGEGDLAGVFALMSAQTRQATLTAETDLEYFEIDKDAIDKLVQDHPTVKETLAHFFRERLLLNLLASLPFFAALSAQERQALAKRFQDRDFEPGDELFFEGAEHDGIWVVLDGRVAVGHETDGAIDRKVLLGPGDFVGSLARLDTAQTDLAAQATTVARCAILAHKAFSDLLAAHPNVSSARERFAKAGVMVGAHVFAGNGTLAGHVVRARG